MRRPLAFLLAAGLLTAACTSSSTVAPQPTATASAPAASQPGGAEAGLVLATTTSTQDSGLLDVLVPAFEKASGSTVNVVAVGGGEALTMGRECKADVLLVHSPASETDFMNGGYGVDRRLVMHNDFLIVGPPNDPAGIKGMTSAVAALKQIAYVPMAFFSPDDKSGAWNAVELALWSRAGVMPGGAWYQKSPQGPAGTLPVASEKGAYTLSDRAAYVIQKDKLALEVMVEKDPALLNVYHVISVSPAKCPNVDAAGAKAFADYVTSADAQALIGSHGLDKYGQPLFFPDAGKTDEQLTQGS